MVKFIRHAGAAGIDCSLHALMYSSCCQNDAAFTGVMSLLRLEAEGSQVAYRTLRPCHASCAWVEHNPRRSSAKCCRRSQAVRPCQRNACPGAPAGWHESSGDGSFGRRSIHAIGSGSTSTNTGTAFTRSTGPTVPSRYRQEPAPRRRGGYRCLEPASMATVPCSRIGRSGVVALGKNRWRTGRDLPGKGCPPRLDRVTHPVIESLPYPRTVPGCEWVFAMRGHPESPDFPFAVRLNLEKPKITHPPPQWQSFHG